MYIVDMAERLDTMFSINNFFCRKLIFLQNQRYRDFIITGGTLYNEKDPAVTG